MSAKMKLAIAFFIVVFLAVIGFSSFQATRTRYRVCMSIDGRSHCAVAEGKTAKEAIQSAMQIDCGLISANRDQLMVCTTKEPDSVQEIPH
jgi:hypothetical protein